jgi:hypothetical protein
MGIVQLSEKTANYPFDILRGFSVLCFPEKVFLYSRPIQTTELWIVEIIIDGLPCGKNDVTTLIGCQSCLCQNESYKCGSTGLDYHAQSIS